MTETISEQLRMAAVASDCPPRFRALFTSAAEELDAEGWKRDNLVREISQLRNELVQARNAADHPSNAVRSLKEQRKRLAADLATARSTIERSYNHHQTAHGDCHDEG